MEVKKFIFFMMTFIVALVVSSNAIPKENKRYEEATRNKSHHLIVGSRNPGDRELTRDYIVKRSQLMRIVTMEKTINVTSYSIITQVAAYDQKTDGTGAFASIISGGPGYQSVKLRFKSQRGRGIDFVVELFGK